MQSLAQGEIREAIRFHPLFAAATMVSPFWFAIGLGRFLRNEAMPGLATQNRRLKGGAIVFFALLILNWIYLILFLP